MKHQNIIVRCGHCGCKHRVDADAIKVQCGVCFTWITSETRSSVAPVQEEVVDGHGH